MCIGAYVCWFLCVCLLVCKSMRFIVLNLAHFPPRSTDSKDFEDLILALRSGGGGGGGGGGGAPPPPTDEVYQSKNGTPYTVRRISIADTHL